MNLVMALLATFCYASSQINKKTDRFMSLIDRIFGGAQRPSAELSRFQSPASQMPATSQSATRRELLRVVLRDTLVKHGIPSSWVQPEMLVSTGGGREPGMHMRLLIKHWDPRLLAHGVAFERSFTHRVELFDPLSPHWLTGVSWQFALDDAAACPEMPDPATWTAPPSPVSRSRPEPAAAPGRPSPDRRAELNRMMAAGDAKAGATSGFEDTQAMGPDGLPHHATQPLPRHTFEKTQPMFKPTEPAGL